MQVLVLNCGSSSLKFQLIDPHAVVGWGGQSHRLARGLIERIGSEATCTFAVGEHPPHRESAPIRDHQEAVRKALDWLQANPTATSGTATLRELDAVGHRVVHGGDRFKAAVRIDADTVAAIEACNELAPLHNPASVSGIRAAHAVLGPDVPMVAVFDTSFHQTLPEHAATYAIPYELARRHRIRRYGFHGLAHRYLALRYGEIVGTSPDRVNIITLHLGNGCSMCAIQGGRSIDTSMGFTPLEGLVMGTRAGDLDPALVGYLSRKEDVPVGEVEAWLNERSGLLGVSGRSYDMRELLAHAREDARTRLAVDLFSYRARKYLGAYLATLGGAEAIVFSGGIGENAPLVRANICEGMQWCGLELDPGRNEALVGAEGRISPPNARIHAYVIPSDEELLIARDTASVIQRN